MHTFALMMHKVDRVHQQNLFQPSGLTACTCFCPAQVMKEKLRKYKARNALLDQQVVQKNNQILVLEDTIVTLKQQLAVRGIVQLGQLWQRGRHVQCELHA